MSAIRSVAVESAPVTWAPHCGSSETGLHQLAPYIGKLKSSIAETLVESFTKPGDLVLDPFCGSGTVPLECVRRQRRAIAADRNPYAVVLTRAKLQPPDSAHAAHDMLEKRLSDAKQQRAEVLIAPDWVRRFFDPETLAEALAFADECIRSDDAFLLSCLLGILHHQRPGFLSYPSSHLVPYLRERKYPRKDYPEMYETRALAPRMKAKIDRVFKRSPGQIVRGSGVVMPVSVEHLELPTEVDVIITSPPYMNALDYVRDNRLRMWFLDRTTANYSPEPTEHRRDFSIMSGAFIQNALGRLRRGGRCVLVVGETVRRKRVTSHPAEVLLAEIESQMPDMCLERVIEDVIPDVRRTRRDGAATKRELILVLRRRGESEAR